MDFQISEESVYHLINQLVLWLRTGPTDQEVIEYCQKTPEDFQILFPRVAETAQDSLFDIRLELWEKMGSNGAAELSEIDQLHFFADLSSYNPISVFANYQRRFPSLTVATLPVPSSVASEAQLLLRGLHATHILMLSSVYLRQLVRVQTAVKFCDETRHPEFEKVFNQIFEVEQNTFLENRPLNEEEVQQEIKLLSSLQFLTPDVTERIIRDDHEQKMEMIEGFLKILSLMTAIGIQEARANPMRIENGLWNLYLEEFEGDCIVRFEGRRLSLFHPDETRRHIIKSLFAIWDLPTIQEKNAGVQTCALAAPLYSKSKGRDMFFDIFEAFIGDCASLVVILQPYTPTYIYTQIKRRQITRPFLPEFIETMTAEITDEEQKALAKSAIDQLFQVITAKNV